MLIGATEEAASQNLEAVKAELEYNDTLCEDFPEICVPIRALEKIVNRCKGQTCAGVHTNMIWSGNSIRLPTIEKSASSGLVIASVGITGRIRGMKARLPNGRDMRPDFVMIDDPQTDESAASPEQNRKRLRIIMGTILGLAGPGQKISAVMPCTVIRPGDMVDEVLNKDKHPEWNGERKRLLVDFPKNMELWYKYNELRADSLRAYEDIRLATQFYKDNRKAMDEGGKPAWKQRHEVDELSALQNCMNLYFKNKEAFYAEYQNEPIDDENAEADKITVDDIFKRMNNRKRGEIPQEAENVVMFIDVQGKLLY